MTVDPLPPRRGLALFGRWRLAIAWAVGALLAVALGLLLVTLSFANATSEGAAKRSLRETLAVLSEVDGYLDDHYEPLQQQAARGDARAIEAPNFPVAVSFTPEEVRDTSRGEFRALLLERAAQVVYDDGVAAFSPEGEGEVSFFSTQGAVKTGMNLLRPLPHRAFAVTTIVLASLAGLLALGLAASSRGYGRLIGLGLSVLAAALPFLVAAIGVRFALRVAAGGFDDYLARELFELGQELTWAPIRNGIIFSAGGALVLVLGAALARWSDARARP